MHDIAESMKTARKIFEKNIGEKGLWASTDRYRWQCWIRDFAIAGLEELLFLERVDIAESHLEKTAENQDKNGRIPDFFADEYVVPHIVPLHKLYRSIVEGRPHILAIKVAEMIRDRRSYQHLTPWTKDSSLYYITAVHDLGERTNNQSFISRHEQTMELALEYTRRFVEGGFLLGGDWRDIYRKFKGVALLSNQILLWRAYKLMGFDKKAASLKDLVNRKFWDNENNHYTDMQDSNTYDAYGQALAVLTGFAEDRYDDITFKTDRYGFLTNDYVSAQTSFLERDAFKRVNQSVSSIWGMINGLVVKAYLEMGKPEEAVQGFVRGNRLENISNEWFLRKTGDPMGSRDVMWSVALYQQTARALKEKDLINY